jgi:hypothetical protein
MSTKKSKKAEAVVPVIDESIPATIVEGTETEVFAPPVEGTVTAVVETPPVAKKEKVNRRPYIAFVQTCLEEGKYTRKEIIAEVMARFEGVRLGGIQTFVTDLRNEKYNHFKERKVIQQANGKLIFEDKVVPVEETPAEVVPVEEVQTMEAPSEQAGE